MEYNLPRGYLSYSAWDLWCKSKEAFRRRYYENEKPFETPETAFGKKIAEMVENDEHHGVLEIINYPKKEYEIDIVVDDLRLLGRLDQFHDTELRIHEIKTGHRNPKGKVPWDTIKVRKHKQLVFYSLLVELKHGTVHPEVILQWIETKFSRKSVEFDGHVLTTKSKELELTGYIKTFKRRVHKWERIKMLKDIKQSAREISNDYTQWLAKK